MTQFLENSIRQALGKPLTVPQDVLGISQRTPNTGVASTAITAADVQGLEDLVREIIRGELATVGE